MYSFNYQKAKSVAEASGVLGAKPDAKILAGGQSLIAAMKLRLANPSDIVDIGLLPDLAGIKVEGANVVIGGMTKHAEVATSADVKSHIPALAELAGHIGDPQVRNRGTMGGSVANNDPAADYPAAVVALNATVTTNTGKHAADGFFKGLFETALGEGEIVTSISFPKAEKAAYMKFPNPASRYAMVGVFVAKTASGVRVAVTGAGPCVFRVKAMEEALAKNFSSAAIKDIKVSATDLNSDIHGSAEYRAHLVNVMAQRAVAAAK